MGRKKIIKYVLKERIKKIFKEKAYYFMLFVLKLHILFESQRSYIQWFITKYS